MQGVSDGQNDRTGNMEIGQRHGPEKRTYRDIRSNRNRAKQRKRSIHIPLGRQNPLVGSRAACAKIFPVDAQIHAGMGRGNSGIHGRPRRRKICPVFRAAERRVALRLNRDVAIMTNTENQPGAKQCGEKTQHRHQSEVIHLLRQSYVCLPIHSGEIITTSCCHVNPIANKYALLIPMHQYQGSPGSSPNRKSPRRHEDDRGLGNRYTTESGDVPWGRYKSGADGECDHRDRCAFRASGRSTPAYDRWRRAR